MTDRDLLQQSLDAHLYHRDQTRPIDRTDAVIEALRTRLAQPAPAVQPCTSKPVDSENAPDLTDKIDPLSQSRVVSEPAVPDDVVVSKNERGDIVAVTRQDSEGRILSVIAESAAPAVREPQDDCTPNHFCNKVFVHLPAGEMCNRCGHEGAPE